MRSEIVRLAGLQGVITATATAAAYKLAAAPLAMWSIAYGGMVAVVATLFMAQRHMALQRKVQSAESDLRLAYRTAFERLVLAASLLAIGMGGLRLAPEWMLAGFVSGQLAWLAAPVWTRLKK